MLQISTASGNWEVFCNQIESFLQADIIDLQVNGRPVRGFRSPDSPALWIRDHSDILRGGKYIEADVTSAIEAFAYTQAANGRIFDHVLPRNDVQFPFEVEEWVRVQVESDVEFRFVKAAYLAFQATGDSDWLVSIVPTLDRALGYSLTHAWRWDKKHRLIKRPYTIDTWDFDYRSGRSEWLNFQIDEKTHWGIFHGDNSGFFESCRLLASMHRVLGNDKKTKEWLGIAASVRARANDLLFNGRFYTHFHPLTRVNMKGVAVDEQLSLSNPMAINRGLATRNIAQAILGEYRQRRRLSPAFAEWFGIDPPFPDGSFGDDKLVGGAYINGGIFPLVGGEIARAALENGHEDYGFQTLDQYRKLIAETGASYLWYFPDGSPSSEENSTSPDAMPTDGWGSSAMLYAFIEGLAGVEDLGHSYETVRCSPRWPAAGEDFAKVKVGYAASGAFFAYGYLHRKKENTILLTFTGGEAAVSLHALLPPDTIATGVFLQGKAIDYLSVQLRNSRYVDAHVKIKPESVIEIRYNPTSSPSSVPIR